MQKKKTNAKFFHLWDEVYRVWVTVGVNCSSPEFENYCAKHYKDYKKVDVNPAWDAYAGTAYNNSDQEIGYVLWIETFDWTIDSQATAVHEIFHLVNHILTHRGITENINDDEAYAYYLGFWVRKIWDKLKPPIKKKKCKKNIK